MPDETATQTQAEEATAALADGDTRDMVPCPDCGGAGCFDTDSPVFARKCRTCNLAGMVPRSVVSSRESMRRFEAQKATERDELTALERAALEKLKEWEKAAAELDAMMTVPVSERDEEYIARYFVVERRYDETETALRAAAKELLRDEE